LLFLFNLQNIITIRLEIKKAANSWEDFRDYSTFPILTQLQTQLHKKKIVIKKQEHKRHFLQIRQGIQLPVKQTEVTLG
jgi:hypothetical protein